jgi:AraC-like DNA-binding protein
MARRMIAEPAEVVSSVRIPAARQYDWWRDAVSETHLSWDLPRRRDGAFAATFRHRRLGPADLVQCACDPCHGRRGRSEIGRQEAPAFGILYILRGRERLRQAGRETVLPAGHFTIWDSTRPIEFELPETLHKITLLLPQDLLERALPGAHDLALSPADGRRGRGAIFAAHLRAVSREAGDLPADRAALLLRATLDLLAATVDGDEGDVGSRHGRAMLARIREFILDNLGDPDLGPEAVAAAAGISPRQLHRLFGGTGATAERWIWRQRLLRCRSELLLQPRERVSQIAFAWGFSDAAHFSHAFREMFGDSPRGYRRRHLEDGGRRTELTAAGDE